MSLFNKKKANKEDNNSIEQINESMENKDSMSDNIEKEQKTSKELLEIRDILGSSEEEVDEPKSINEQIDEVIDYFTQVDPIKLNMLERGKLSKDIFIDEVHQYIKTKITKDKNMHDKIFNGFSSFVWSYDILDELINDNSISDIKVYEYNNIRIKRLGKRLASTVQFRSEKHFLKFIEHVAIKNKVSISDQNAAQNFVDKTNSESAILRFNITTGFINSSARPVLHIRKTPRIKYTTEDLIGYGFFTQEQAEYLKGRAISGGGILFAGQGGSGKTTAMNWLIDFLPDDVSGLVIQENEEMHSNHPDMAFQHTVQNRGEGKIEYSLGDLARNGLLTDIDYFIIGEIKGQEALYLLNAVYTGAKGWATVHGASATEAMKKLVDYVKYNSDYTQDEVLQMLVHLDTVVFMNKFNVTEIAEVVGYDEKKKDLVYKKIY